MARPGTLCSVIWSCLAMEGNEEGGSGWLKLIPPVTLKMGIMASWTGWDLASKGSPDKQLSSQKLQGPAHGGP